MAQSLTHGPPSPTTKKRKPDHEPAPGSPTKKSRKDKKDRSSKEKKKDRSRKHGASQEVDDTALAAQLQLSAAASSQESKHIPSSTDDKESSTLYMETYSMYLPIAPICQEQPLEAVCAEHLSPLLLSYQNRMNGVVLAYENVRLSDDGGAEDVDILSKAINEQASTFIWVTADFLVFRPKRGQRLEGWITLQNDSHIGLTCWNLVNASIERKRLPESWTWVDHVLVEGEDFSTVPSIPKGKHGSGHYIDDQGQEVGGMLSFTVADYEYLWMSEAERGLLRIEGTLLDDLNRGAAAGTAKKGRHSHKNGDTRRSILKDRPSAS